VTELTVRPIVDGDRDWLRRFVRDRWGADTVVGHDTVYRPAELPGFVAVAGREPAGLITYHVVGADCEVVTIDSVRPGRGIGTALLAAVEEQARRAGCRRVWLVTTNDNLNALGFYQKRGYRLVRIDRGAVDRARRLKPEIPLVGDRSIPLRDEIELERVLKDGSDRPDGECHANGPNGSGGCRDF
jgi:DNA-3-methyladenine glycosylase I